MDNGLLNNEHELKLVKEKEAAQLLGRVSVSTLRRWRLLGTGPVYRKLNGSVRYLGSDIQHFLDQNARISTGRPA